MKYQKMKQIKKAIKLMRNDTFIVRINNKSVILRPILKEQNKKKLIKQNILIMKV